MPIVVVPLSRWKAQELTVVSGGVAGVTAVGVGTVRGAFLERIVVR